MYAAYKQKYKITNNTYKSSERLCTNYARQIARENEYHMVLVLSVDCMSVVQPHSHKKGMTLRCTRLRGRISCLSLPMPLLIVILYYL